MSYGTGVSTSSFPIDPSWIVILRWSSRLWMQLAGLPYRSAPVITLKHGSLLVKYTPLNVNFMPLSSPALRNPAASLAHLHHKLGSTSRLREPNPHQQYREKADAPLLSFYFTRSVGAVHDRGKKPQLFINIKAPLTTVRAAANAPFAHDIPVKKAVFRKKKKKKTHNKNQA